MADMYDESYNNPYHFNRRSKVSAYQQKLKDRSSNGWILENMFGKENKRPRNESAPSMNPNYPTQYDRNNLQTPTNRNVNNDDYLNQYQTNPYRVPTIVMPVPTYNPNESNLNNESMDKTFEETPRRDKKKYRDELLQQIEDKKKRDQDRKRQEQEMDKLYEDRYNREMEEEEKRKKREKDKLKSTQKKRKRPEDIETNNPPPSNKYKRPRNYPPDNNDIERDYDKFLDKQFKNINYDLSNKIDAELKKLKQASGSNYAPYKGEGQPRLRDRFADPNDKDQKRRLYDMIFNENPLPRNYSTLPRYPPQPAYFGYNNEGTVPMYTQPDKNLDIESQYVPVNDPRNSSVPPTGMEPMYKTLREIEKLNPNNPEKEKKLNPKYKMRDVDIIGPEDIKQYQNYKPKNYNIPYKTEPDVEYPPRNDYYNVGPTGKVEESSESSKKPSVTENKESEPEIESEPKPKPETKKKIDKDKKHKKKKKLIKIKSIKIKKNLLKNMKHQRRNQQK